jgi:hypothetical protein
MSKESGKDGGTKKPVPPQITANTPDEKRAARNVAKIRERLSEAMDDPQMREQIVNAVRRLMHEDEK